MRSFSRTTKYYFCSQCQPTSSPSETSFTEFTDRNVTCSALLDEDRVRTVQCMSCNTALGYKYVQVPAAQLCSLVQNERYNLNLGEALILEWKTESEWICSNATKPIPGPEPVFQLVPEPTLLTGDIDQHQALFDNNMIAPQPQPPNPPQGNGDEPPADVDVGEHAPEA